ncbi:catechol 2,3-dioxygenase-like lactoylglutathione lyase family enzyme [Rhizobium sp. BIGb0125]|jgi:catechol 2,3-dioxygenase-like lactoylglutathione lyase family enzyme|uniref:VOC family protein n=1 Tax=Rhizobium sp. BIGb0125 TaxID=2940618 RepID=UPI002166E9D7|nr:VOC family protein [Rhizobium sp. BIGb0125]MCS4241047.1 catechol 2,3-dioxygenase-like lactoylglutathione lyase family enzyme [Rhizobium sp. BIGb0125]
MSDSRDANQPFISFQRTCPIIRIFDEDKAREFYVDFLGFQLDWEHRFGDNFPLYMQVSRAGLVLHLSGHHGDASPGSNTFVVMKGVQAYQKELIAKDYTYMKPGVETLPWGLQMEVTDPFSNRIRFCEQNDGGEASV